MYLTQTWPSHWYSQAQSNLCRRFILYVCAEVLGAIVASALLQAALPGKLAVNCTLGPGVTHGQAIVVEGFLTAALTLTVLLVAVEKHRSTPFAPCAIGLVLFATHLFGVVFTGAALNSARAFGPALLTGFTNYQWVYWVGPSIGALVATAVYYVLKAVDLYSLTPKQDSDQIDDSPDLMGIEVKMRRRNSFGSTAGSGSHMGMSSTKKFRDGAPRHHHHPAYPRMGPPPFIPNPEYMHRGPYEAPHDYYQTFSPRSAGGHPAEKTHRAHFENNPIKLAYPKRSSHLSSGEESSQGYQHQLQQHQLSGKLAYPKRSSQVSLGEEKSQGYQHHLQQQQTSGKLASNSKADYPPRSSEELKEIPIWSPYSVIPLQPGLGTHYHR